MPRKLFNIILTLLTLFPLAAQTDKPLVFRLSGYVHNMQSVYFDSIRGNWVNDNLIHSRLNLQLAYKSNFTFNLSVRNRIFTGETVKYFPGYSDFVKKDMGIVPLSWNAVSEQSVLWNIAIDRLNVHYSGNNFELTLGRQRINWAKTFVWNPNDLFNNYSFFDVDYAERPGSDAIDAIYYLSPMTSVEIASKLDRDTNLTSAVKFATTVGTYDIQLLAGILNSQDYAVGLGWTGYIKNITFRGEGTYLHPKKNFADTTGLFLMSIGLDYSLKNSITFIGEFLYNPQKDNLFITSPMDLYSAPMDVKHLSLAKYSVFAQVLAQPYPLLNTSMAFMYFPKEKGYFLMPSLTYSLADNADLSVIGQIFKGDFPTPAGNNTTFNFNAIFIRLSLNFSTK